MFKIGFLAKTILCSITLYNISFANVLTQEEFKDFLNDYEYALFSGDVDTYNQFCEKFLEIAKKTSEEETQIYKNLAQLAPLKNPNKRLLAGACDIANLIATYNPVPLIHTIAQARSSKNGSTRGFLNRSAQVSLYTHVFITLVYASFAANTFAYNNKNTTDSNKTAKVFAKLALILSATTALNYASYRLNKAANKDNEAFDLTHKKLKEALDNLMKEKSAA